MNGLEAKDRSALIQLAMFLVCYGAVLLLLLDHIPLWLDEIMTLNVANQRDLQSFLRGVKTTQGGTPLAFLPMAAATALLGDTVFASRIWSAIASVVACAGIFMLARRFGLRQPLIPVIVFSLWPLQFRYAMEARPYAMALCLSIWSTVVFLQWLGSVDGDAARLPDHRQKNRGYALWYGALALALAYVMVYSLFVPAAHAIWLTATKSGRRAPRSLVPLCLCALLAAGVSLVPWYLAFRSDWVAASQHQHVTPVTFDAIRLILHELTGAGYIGSVFVASGVWLGCLLPRGDEAAPHRRAFYLTYLLVPVGLVPMADLIFYYFFAIRQLIFIVPPIVVLFASGLEQRRMLGKVLLVGTAVTFLYADASWMTRPHENWNAAGAAAEVQLADPNSCAIFLPPQDGSVFQHPAIMRRACRENLLGAVVLLISPYEADESYAATTRRLNEQGYVKRSEQHFTGPQVEVYLRP